LQFCFSLVGFTQSPFGITLDKTKGLPSNKVYEIFEDSKGYIWITTEEGLARYDGYKFKNYSYDNQFSKAGNNLQEDKYGRIWYVTFDNYIYYTENDSLKLFNKKPGINSFSTILENNLFFIQLDKIDVYSIETFKHVKSLKIKTENLSAVAKIENQLYIAFDSLICVLNVKGEITHQYIIQLNGELITYISKFNDQVYIVGSRGNQSTLYKLEGEQFRHTNLKFTSNIVKFYALKHGLFFLDDETLFTLDKNNKQKILLNHVQSSCMTVDTKGNNWVGTLNQGIQIIPSFEKLKFELPLREYSFVDQIKDEVWMCTSIGEIYTVDTALKKIKHIYTSNLKKEIYNFTFLTGLPINYRNNFNGFTYNNKTVQISITGMKKLIQLDHKYIAFAASASSGLKVMKGVPNTPSLWDKQYQRGTVVNDKGEESSMLVVESRSKSVTEYNGKLYFASNNGIYWFSHEKKGKLKFQNEEIYSSQMEQYKDELYILTNGGRLLILNKNDEVFKVSDVKEISSLKVSGNYLFVLSLYGIYYTDLSALNSETKHIKFSKLQTNISTDLVQQVLVVNNQVWLFTQSSILKSAFNNQVNDIPFYINQINKQTYNEAKHYQFQHYQNDITIQFSILDYLQPLSHTIKYRINQQEWKEVNEATRSIELASLEAGKYEIEFMMDDLIRNEKVRFEILKPWFKTWSFIIALIVIVIALFYGIYKWQLNIQKEKNKLNLEKVQLQNSLKQSMMSSIKAQMNPHFLFNALNTIQSFIMSEDKRNASTYLSKFSKLTRLILEMSEKETITLADEIESLKLYLDLEKIRFEYLEYNITLHSGVNADSIHIPSMIVQPYVENAIKHGLLHKKDNRVLSLSFERLSDHKLLITIEDNGIGRKRSQELNQIKHKKHKSFATEANLKRLDILNQDNQDISIEYIDKFDNVNQAAGTTVKIIIPI
jgi:ligand-binding sensor domain-containing protein/anti-sigma regulatory factor (Ser/Thr protein kinase)